MNFLASSSIQAPDTTSELVAANEENRRLRDKINRVNFHLKINSTLNHNESIYSLVVPLLVICKGSSLKQIYYPLPFLSRVGARSGPVRKIESGSEFWPEKTRSGRLIKIRPEKMTHTSARLETPTLFLSKECTNKLLLKSNFNIF